MSASTSDGGRGDDDRGVAEVKKRGIYRVRQVVMTWVELILIRDVPLPISFCLGSLMFGRIGW